MTATKFTRPVERIAFLAMLAGIAMLLAGAAWYWADRDRIDWYNIFDDIDAMFESRYGRQWHFLTRVGLALSLGGYTVAYHYDRLVAPALRAAARLLHWIRTGG